MGVREGTQIPDSRGRRIEKLMRRWFTTTHHADIGIMYIVSGFVFFVMGGILALIMRVEVAIPGETLVSAETYNSLFTTHGTTMIFLWVIPVLVGFANFLVPPLCGAPDMAFPRLNALSSRSSSRDRGWTYGSWA
jgi:cytochrome c oxidase subunit 1